MPRVTDGISYRSVTVSGLPPRAVNLIRDLAKQRGVRPRDLWTEMIEELLSAVNTPNPPRYEATLKGGKKTTFWPREDVRDRMIEVCEGKGPDQRPVSVSSFLITALQLWAEKRGIHLEF